MLDSLLTTQQLAVICALSSGATVTNAAAEAGIHRNTIANWRRNDLHFQEALSHAQYDRALLFREKIESLVDLAIHTLHDLLVDPKTPASVRLKAALTILQTAATPPDPKRQTLPEAHNPAQPQPQPESQPEGAPQPQPQSAPQPQPQNTVDPIHVSSRSFAANPPHNPAQHPHPKVGRNDACPCGSGLKFKRCCLNQPRAQAAAAA